MAFSIAVAGLCNNRLDEDMTLTKDASITVLRMAGVSLVIYVVPKVLVRLDMMEWRKLEYIPYVVAAGLYRHSPARVSDIS
jgi:hypothetical protein